MKQPRFLVLIVLPFAPVGAGFAQTCCPAACALSVNGDIDLRLPFRSGEQYRVTQNYCTVCSTMAQGDHHGFEVDFCMPEGTPVFAAAGGGFIDLIEPTGVPCGDPPMPGCTNLNGRFVRVRHQGQSHMWYSYYGHLSNVNPSLVMGAPVAQGDLLGWSGNTGWSSGPHLHFQIRQDSASGSGARPVPMASEGIADFNVCQVYTAQGPPVFAAGQMVEVFGLPTGSSLNVHDATDPCGLVTGNVANGTVGTITGGPLSCDLGSGCSPNYRMWRVQWPGGLVGWSAQNWLGPNTTPPPQWTVTNLHPAGADYSGAVGVSGGQQVGYAAVGGNFRASLWSGTAASWVDLTPAGLTSSEAHGVANTRQVGRANFGAGHARLWSGSANSFVDLNPPGATYSDAQGIDSFQQVGYAYFGGPVGACLWSGTAASYVNLAPAWSTQSVAFGVDGGEQVGFAADSGGPRASLWRGSVASWVDLNPSASTGSTAWGVQGGQQVGSATIGGVAHASLWSGTAGSWTDLSPTGASSTSVAYGVNSGTQVGFATVGGFEHASLWNGTSASWVDLHAYLPAAFSWSEAHGAWSDGTSTYVVGYGYNTTTMRQEALKWVGPLGHGGTGCYPNCDNSTIAPILNVNDFTCFLNKFAGGDSYANCDGSTVAPVLNVNDFVCFLNAFAAGCS